MVKRSTWLTWQVCAGILWNKDAAFRVCIPVNSKLREPHFIKLKVINKITINIPSNDTTKKYSATDSKRLAFFISGVLMDINEKIQEQVNNTAITEVNSSILCISV